MSLCRARLLPVGVVHRGAGILQEVRRRASVMEILVDRFLRTRNGLVFDLASSSEAVFARSTAGVGREHSAWVDRCAALASIPRPTFSAGGSSYRDDWRKNHETSEDCVRDDGVGGGGVGRGAGCPGASSSGSAGQPLPPGHHRGWSGQRLAFRFGMSKRVTRPTRVRSSRRLESVVLPTRLGFGLATSL